MEQYCYMWQGSDYIQLVVLMDMDINVWTMDSGRNMKRSEDHIHMYHFTQRYYIKPKNPSTYLYVKPTLFRKVRSHELLATRRQQKFIHKETKICRESTIRSTRNALRSQHEKNEGSIKQPNVEPKWTILRIPSTTNPIQTKTRAQVYTFTNEFMTENNVTYPVLAIDSNIY